MNAINLQQSTKIGQTTNCPVCPIKPVQPAAQKDAWEHIPNHAQYKGSDFSTAVRVERGITVKKAKEIADNDPEIDYFFYVKGVTMVLEVPKEGSFDKEGVPLVQHGSFIYDSGKPGHGAMRVFHHGDVVFFKKGGEWLGTAPGLADVYRKR